MPDIKVSSFLREQFVTAIRLSWLGLSITGDRYMNTAVRIERVFSVVNGWIGDKIIERIVICRRSSQSAEFKPFN